MIKNLLLLILFSVSSNLFAQNSSGAEKKYLQQPSVERELTIQEMKDALEGSFQIEMVSSHKRVLYTRALFEAIKAARKEFEDVIIQWDQYTTITVFSAQRMNTSIEQH